MAHIPFYKRKYLVNRRFQLIITGYFLALHVVVIYFLYVSTRTMLDKGYADLLNSASASGTGGDLLQAFRDQQVLALNKIFLACSLMGTVFIFFGGILISHRIAGPLYRLQKMILAAAEGDSSALLKFRKHDFFQETFLELEQTIRNRVAKEMKEDPKKD